MSNSLAHTKWVCKYHIVFTPKYRRKIIYYELRKDIQQIIKDLCKWKGVEIIEGHMMPDHIHLLVSVPPKMSISAFMGYLKGKSAMMIFERHANLKYKFGNRNFWATGYYVSTVGINTATVQKYIRDQEKQDQIESKLTNDIFRNEMLRLYEQKSESRDELVREARRAMLELVQTMRDGVCNHPDAERLMLELAAQLETVKGKKSYGYLPKRLKKLVDEIVDEMERLPSVSKCYNQWRILQGNVDAYYHDKPQKRILLSKQKEFTQIKNAVIHEAEHLRLDEITFEEKDLGQHDEPEEFRNESYDYWTLRDVIRDESLTMEEHSYAVSEMNKLAESGDMYAQYLMGKLWRDGPLLIPDSVEARCWFEQAAEQGHIVAQYSLAKLCLSDAGYPDRNGLALHRRGQ